MRHIYGFILLVLLMPALYLISEMTTAGGAEGASELVGKWRFVTTGDYEGYVNGNLKVDITEAGETTCKLVVYQSEFGSAVESCRIEVSGDEVLIEVEEVVTSSVPNWRKESFRLSRAGNEMTGQVKIVVDFPVRFTRKK